MKVPIIIVDHGDITIFESVANAECWLEPTDVRNGEYLVYDRSGHLLRLDVIQTKKKSLFGKAKFIDTVKMIDLGKESDTAIDLHGVLIDFFKRTSTYDPEDQSSTLSELVEKAVARFGYCK